MPDRYYSAEPIDGPSVTLGGSEAHHLLHVMRAQPGLELIVFDGQGGQFTAEISECKRSTVSLAVGERQDIERELPFDLTLAVTLPKGDRQRWLIEKCVELGVTRVVPLNTERSVAKVDKAEKLTRYVIEASKQCGRNRLMQITSLVAWSDFLAEATIGQRLLAHPGGQPLGKVPRQPNDSENVIIVVGPEGGFSENEVSQAVESAFETVGLGERILRIETAALTLVSVCTLLRP